MNKWYSICCIASMLIMVSCSNEEEIMPLAVRTVIVYMAADNDLSADALSDIEEMKQGYLGNATNLLVFVDLEDANPRLFKINGNKEETLATYPELNASDPAVLERVVNDCITLYPTEEYGLILWSHGTSWLPAGSRLRSFGKDGSSKEMNIVELAEALSSHHFRFILFDACLMGAVEVVYELRNCADYIIASSTETIADGFPYHLIMPELLAPSSDLTLIAKRYFDYYDSQPGVYRSATVSVIKTEELEGLAIAMKQLIENAAPNELFNRAEVQRLDVYNEQYHFDLLDFITKAYSGADKETFVEQLSKAVIYKNHTPQFIRKYDIATYCGLSVYIPHPARPDLNEFHTSLKWYEDAGVEKITGFNLNAGAG